MAEKSQGQRSVWDVYLGGGNSNIFFMFNPQNLGKIPILANILKGVGSTTNQIYTKACKFTMGFQLPTSTGEFSPDF